MIAPAGPLTHTDRDALRQTADMLALLPLPGCAETSMDLRAVADSARPDPAQIMAAATRCDGVRHALLIEATPDRWADQVGELGADVVDDLISTRTTQASQVATAADILGRSVRARATQRA